MTLAESVIAGDRLALARAITLVESTRQDHQERASELLEACLPHTGRGVRVGITGVPGVGKSTFIEALGMHIIGERHEKVAVLAIDPSSPVTGGSILGDKTRMPRLASDPNSFIRPSPSGGWAGGVGAKTREAMLLCEAAGFENVFVETIGVGQSEVAVASMVDFFVLLMLTGAGDDLQGIKRGVLELAHLVAFNKADGDNRARAQAAKRQLQNALSFLPPHAGGWKTPVEICSARDGGGIAQIWQTILDRRTAMVASGELDRMRKQQAREAMYSTIRATLSDRFFSRPEVRAALPQLEKDVMEGRLSVYGAARSLLQELP